MGNEKKLFKTVLDSMNSAVVIIDSQGFIIYLNRMGEELLGVSFAEINGAYYSDAFPMPPEERFTLITLQTGLEFKDIGYKKRRFNNRKIITDTLLLRDDNGNVLGAAGIFKDITVFHEMEYQLREGAKLSLMGEMAAGMAHEIRNPLASIKGYLQFMEQKAQNQNLSGQKVMDYCSIMKDELERLNNLTNDFLQLAKLNPKNMEPLDLNKLVESIAAVVSHRVCQKGIRLELDCCKNAWVSGEEASLKQVLINLINNAIDVLPPEGELKVITKIDRDWAYLQVVDNGPGIPPGVSENIFTPFYSTKEGGTGLGLAISQRIVHGHKGKIKVESEQGQGARFIINLPAYRAEGGN